MKHLLEANFLFRFHQLYGIFHHKTCWKDALYDLNDWWLTCPKEYNFSCSIWNSCLSTMDRQSLTISQPTTNIGYNFKGKFKTYQTLFYFILIQDPNGNKKFLFLSKILMKTWSSLVISFPCHFNLPYMQEKKRELRNHH